MTSEPVFRAEGEGDYVFGMRACITIKLAADDVEERRCSVLEILAPEQFGPPLHIHHQEDELVQVLEGRLRVVCGDRDELCAPGDFAFLPRGVPHTFWVLEGPARILVTFTPGGVEAMFVDAGVPGDSARLPEPGTVASGAMDELERRHQVEAVGPPLQG